MKAPGPNHWTAREFPLIRFLPWLFFFTPHFLLQAFRNLAQAPVFHFRIVIFFSSSLIKSSEVAQSCPTLCDPMDCSLPGSSVHGISRQEYWSGLPFPSPGGLPNPGIEPGSPVGRCFYRLSHQGSHKVSMYLVSGFVIAFHLWPTAVLSSQCPQKEQVVMTLKKKRGKKKMMLVKTESVRNHGYRLNSKV